MVFVIIETIIFHRMIFLGFLLKKINETMLKYCLNCVMPNIRIHFDEKGICSACNFFQNRKTTSWSKRKVELENY